jgi:hypothetical protein
MTKERSRPEGRLIADTSLDLEGQGNAIGNKINTLGYQPAKPRSTSAAYRKAAPRPSPKTAITAPQDRRAGGRESNLPVGSTYGNRFVLGWSFDKERYAIQTRLPAVAKQLKRRKDVVLFADALVGPWMQTLLVPCCSEAKGRKLVDSLLQSAETGSDSSLTIQEQQRGAAKSPQNYSVADLDQAERHRTTQTEGRQAADGTEHPAWDWTYFEDRLDAIGTEFCVLFPRFDGQWAVQLKDPRLIACFNKRARTRLSGYSVGGWGQLRQYIFPCKSKAWARKVLLTALSTLPEYEANKHKLKGAMQ